MCQKDIGATHVVTEVKTGFNAFLLFESKRSENISKKEVGDSMDTLVKGLPAEIVEGDGIADDDKSEVEKERISLEKPSWFAQFTYFSISLLTIFGLYRITKLNAKTTLDMR